MQRKGPRAESPEYVQTSLAAALTLGLKRGRFYRDARLGCLNLLLTYADGCAGRCSYCGLAGNRDVDEGGRTFIRVGWPTYPVDQVLRRAREVGDRLRRVCVSMVTHPRAIEDSAHIIRRTREEAGLPVSALIAPTLARGAPTLRALRESGADCVGVAVDLATEELFERHRGAGVDGPHRWDRYWRAVADAVTVFGRRRVSVHLIVGLGETEREMVEVIERSWALGAVPHLFAFFPEAGSPLEGRPQPPVSQYRRVQLARHLIASGRSRAAAMAFGEGGRIVDFGVDVAPLLREGYAFKTSGCPGPDGETACNRPYGNERPGRILYNYPFAPEPFDLDAIAAELGGAGGERCPGCTTC